jgi:hypothetical protein
VRDVEASMPACLGPSKKKGGRINQSEKTVGKS